MNSTASTARSNVERLRDRLAAWSEPYSQSAEWPGIGRSCSLGAVFRHRVQVSRCYRSTGRPPSSCHFDPIVASDGSLQVDHLLPDSPDGVALAASVRSGARPGLSVEFYSLDEAQVQGVREVRQSLVTAVATVPSQSYDQAKAEVRSTTRVVAWWRR